MAEEPKESALAQAYRAVGPYLSLGIELMAAILLFFAAGWWLDGKLGTEPFLMLGGALLGMAAGFYHVLKALLRSDGAHQEGDAQSGDGE